MSDDFFGDSRGELFPSDEGFGEEELGELGEEDFGLGDEGADMPDFGEAAPAEEEGERPTLFGLNRTFVLVGGGIALVVCVAIVALVLVILGGRGPDPIQLTIAAVNTNNAQVAAYLAETDTRNTEVYYETATATMWTMTPSPTPTDTPTPSPTAEMPTNTPLFVTPTPGGEGIGGGGLEPGVVAQTATALAAILAGATEVMQVSGLPTPTPETGVVVPGRTPIPTALPSTGLFDSIGTGGGINGLATAGLAAIALAAVIVVARRLRAG
jgi:hypothetical protein